MDPLIPQGLFVRWAMSIWGPNSAGREVKAPGAKMQPGRGQGKASAERC